MVTVFKADKHSTLDVRAEALKTLVEWETRRGSLDEITERYLKALAARNRPYYTALVKGVVRHRGWLDYKLQKILNRPLESLTPWIRNILRLGGFQLDKLSIPKPVTVDVMVELSKIYGHSGTAKLANGVLRRWSSGYSPRLPRDPMEALSIRYSHPQWLADRWVKRFGLIDAEKLLEWNNSIPTMDIRLNLERISGEEFLEICRDHGIAAKPLSLEGSFSLEWHGTVEAIPGFQEGFFWMQGESAQFPVCVLDPRPGEMIVDLCAAPGGKSCQIADMMKHRGEVLAVDHDPERLKKMEENRRRMGFSRIRPFLADGRDLTELLARRADAVLLDAPCSATGVLRKNVDARWNREPGDLVRFAGIQRELLESASKIVKPGGRIVYSTCSLEPEENEEVIRQFIQSSRSFALEDPAPYLPNSVTERIPRHEPFLHIFPQTDQMDGFFVARLKRHGND